MGFAGREASQHASCSRKRAEDRRQRRGDCDVRRERGACGIEVAHAGLGIGGAGEARVGGALIVGDDLVSERAEQDLELGAREVRGALGLVAHEVEREARERALGACVGGDLQLSAVTSPAPSRVRALASPFG